MLKPKSAFTLIELLVVVLIIGILAAAAVPQYQKSVLKSKLAESMIVAKAVKEAEDRYFLAAGSYTADINDLDVDVSFKNCVSSGSAQTTYYTCDNKKSFIIRANGGAGSSSSVYVYTNADYAMEFYFAQSGSPNLRYCLERTTAAQSVCVSLGGTLTVDNVTGKYYTLH
ncbi:MAG: prepilin-type N-terminal cleavage/methylation domain-containing protein [Elusimicrobium sp.]|jgi:type IV pilus assembly protein PilE|nr:prepilin-type N-terminal cleavage/methylation domain-containing protein [Elusimicrobium sp.]